MIRRYVGYQERGVFARRRVTVLTVRCRSDHENTATTTPKQGKRRTRMSPFATGLLLGALVAGGIVTRLLKTKRDAKQGVFSWPAETWQSRGGA